MCSTPGSSEFDAVLSPPWSMSMWMSTSSVLFRRRRRGHGCQVDFRATNNLSRNKCRTVIVTPTAPPPPSTPRNNRAWFNLRPSLLVERARRRFEAKGGVVLEFTSIDGVSVRPDGVALATSPSTPPGGPAKDDGGAAGRVRACVCV